MSEWQTCAALVERGDPERFRAAMAAPVPARAVLFPIYAMALEAARAPWVTQEPMIAEMRLQWWRDALEEIAQGGDVRRHEVTTPLAAVLTKPGAKALDELVEARRWDIYKDPFEDEAHFTRYLERTSGALLFAGCDALGASNRAVCDDAGYGAGLARFLKAIPELEAQKRVPLVDGRREAIVALAEGARARLRRARQRRRDVAFAPFIALWETDAILAQAQRDPAAVSEGRLGVGDFRSSLSLGKAALLRRW